MKNAHSKSTTPLALATLALAITFAGPIIAGADTAEAKRFKPRQAIEDITGVTILKKAGKAGKKAAGMHKVVSKPLRKFGKGLQRYGIGR